MVKFCIPLVKLSTQICCPSVDTQRTTQKKIILVTFEIQIFKHSSLSLSSCLVSKSIIKNIEKDFVTKKKFLQMPPTTPMEAISFPLEIFSSTTYYLVKLTTPVVSQHLCLSEFHPVSLSVCLFVLISFICLLIALYRFVCLSVIKLPSLFCFVIISITMFNASISVYLFYFSFVVRFCWSLCYVSVFVSLFTSVTIFSP